MVGRLCCDTGIARLVLPPLPRGPDVSLDVGLGQWMPIRKTIIEISGHGPTGPKCPGFNAATSTPSGVVPRVVAHCLARINRRERRVLVTFHSARRLVLFRGIGI